METENSSTPGEATTTAPETPPDPKVEMILNAAFEGFAQYGFRRTSMEDIARNAGISRPALYLHFRNKEDILRGLTTYYFDRAVAGMTQALQADPDPVRALHAALIAKDAGVMEKLLTSPHAADLLDVKLSNSADIVETGEARMRSVLCDWISRETPEYDQPDLLACTILSAAKGLKSGFRNTEAYLTGQRQIAEAFGGLLQK